MKKLDDIHLRMKNHGDFATPNVEKHYRPSLELEPIHQEIKLRFDLPNKKAEGIVTTTIKANGITTNHIIFNAIDLNIRSVKGPNRWDYDGKIINLYWDTPFTKGEKRERLNYVSRQAYKLDEALESLSFQEEQKLRMYPVQFPPEVLQSSILKHEDLAL